MNYKDLTEADLIAYMGDRTASELNAEASRCSYRDGRYCDAPNPGEDASCLFCKNTRGPEDHPWNPFIQAMKDSL
jgi:hypothetical protein